MIYTQIELKSLFQLLPKPRESRPGLLIQARVSVSRIGF